MYWVCSTVVALYDYDCRRHTQKLSTHMDFTCVHARYNGFLQIGSTRNGRKCSFLMLYDDYLKDCNRLGETIEVGNLVIFAFFGDHFFDG
jgi:hypothetical protein